MRIDINSDLGEGFGRYTCGDDDALLAIVTSANVACGFHAGDPEIMARTFRAAKARGIAVIDEFTAAGGNWPGLHAIPIAEPTEFETFIATRKDATLSSYSEYFIAVLRGHMEALRASSRTSSAPPRT